MTAAPTPSGEDVEVILVALIVSIISPVLMALLTGHQERKNKRLDWDRQDELTKRALRAAEAAKDAADDSRDASEHASETADKAAEARQIPGDR